MTHTDLTLFHLIANKNEAAFTRIYRAYHPVLFSCVKQMLKNDTYAEDIVQEVFIKLWQAGEELKCIQSPGGWLRTLAARHTINHLKKEARDRQALQLLSQRPDFIPGDAEINFRELQAILKKVIMKLPMDTGIILCASIEEGLDRKKIAEGMGLPVDVVKNKLEYGRQVLRKCVREYAGVWLPWVLVAAAMM